MKFFVTSDADKETGLSEIIYELNRSPMDDFFVNRFYDDSEIGIGIVLMGRDPRWDFKQRISFSKGKNSLYADLMFDWHEMVNADDRTRKQIAAEKIMTEVPQIIAGYKSKGKYGFKDFDLPRFTRDLREWFETNGWIEPGFPELIEE